MSGNPKPVTFVRPDPSEFVLLVAKTRGNGIVAGTTTFKPSGTEWATERDLRDAGYVSLADAKKAVRRMMLEIAVTPAAHAAAREAMAILGVEP